MSILDDYQLAVSNAAGQFQFLEEGMKMYLDDCFELIRDSLGGKIRFEYERKDIQNKTAKTLVSLFAKYCPNEGLVEKLRPLPDKRNYVAHQLTCSLHTRSVIR
jgi:hypothetical protein